ncbi:hypothetical protein [Holophaga foetida]|uniref:hypothetical protein n=1 Tax=Holophaga foetida TaxID=35839 RepID=UPI0002474693|nr:hypothetical protein [Holophaga foetida]
MTASAKKAPKKEKDRKQSPEERLEANRYNQMMYGPTAGELRPVPKKTNYGAPYLKHPKFQELMTAFKKGSAFKFDVSDKSKVYTVSTRESQILFDDKVIYYCRPLNKHEQNLLLDRSVTIQHQTNEVLVHLVFAVLQSLPELGPMQLSFRLNQFQYGSETLEAGIATQGPNLLLGSFKHIKAQEKTRT